MFADTIQYEFLAVGEIERKLRKSPNNINMEPLIICFRFVKSDNCLLWPFIEHTVIRPFLARKVLVFVKTGANLKLLIYMSSLGPKTSWLAVKQKHSVEEQLCKQRLIQYLIQKRHKHLTLTVWDFFPLKWFICVPTLWTLQVLHLSSPPFSGGNRLNI